MQVSVESVGNLERRMTLRLPAERIEDQIGGRLREIARTARIKGFRPGKIPAKVIEQRFGGQVRNEAYGDLIRESLGEAIAKENLRVAGNPEVKAEPAGDAGEIRYSAIFEVVPDFGKVDPAQLKISRVSASISDTGPTRGSTSIPKACAARTMELPGSAMAGMPASLTKPTS